MSSSGAVKGSGGVAAKARPGPVKEDGGGKGKGAAALDVKKKVDRSIKPFSPVKSKPTNVVLKVEGKKVTSSSTTRKTTTKAEKKVYSLPGQKYDIPEEREPLRIFYESLSKQIPSSEMAVFWMMEHGLLSLERAKKAYERKQRRQQQLRMGTPIKSNKQERPRNSKDLKASNNGDVRSKKRIDYSNDDDFTVKSKKSKA